MRLVKVHTKFTENKDAGAVEDAVESLQRSLEGVVAGWLNDTGLWNVDISVQVQPGVQPGRLGVSASVVAEMEPLRTEAGGFG